MEKSSSHLSSDTQTFKNFCSAELKKLLDDIHTRYGRALESLTKEQFQQAIEQALLCGDFIRIVRIHDNAQTVVYIPYAAFKQLTDENADLYKQIAALREYIKELESSKPDPTAPPFTGPEICSKTITHDDLLRAFQDGRNSHSQGMP